MPISIVNDTNCFPSDFNDLPMRDNLEGLGRELHSVRQDTTALSFSSTRENPVNDNSIKTQLVSVFNKMDDFIESNKEQSKLHNISTGSYHKNDVSDPLNSNDGAEESSDVNYYGLLVNKLNEFTTGFIKNEVLTYNKEKLAVLFYSLFMSIYSEDIDGDKVNKVYYSINAMKNSFNKIADFVSCFDNKNNTYSIDFDEIEKGGLLLFEMANDISDRLKALLANPRFKLELEMYTAGENLNEVFETLLSNSGNEDGKTLFDLLHPYHFMEKRLREVAKKENASLDDKVRVYFENTDILRVIENPLYTALPSFLKKDNHWEERKQNSDKNRYFFKEYTIKQIIGGYHRYEAAKDNMVTLSDIKPCSKGYHAGELDILSGMDIFTEYKSYFSNILKNESVRSELKNMIAGRINGIIAADLAEYRIVRFEGGVTTGLLARTTGSGVEFKSLLNGKEYQFDSWKTANAALNQGEGDNAGIIKNEFLSFIKTHCLLSQKDIYPQRKKWLDINQGMRRYRNIFNKCEISAGTENCTVDVLYQNMVDNCLADMDYLSKSDYEISVMYWMSWTKDLFAAISVAAMPFGFIGLFIDVAASIPSMIQAAIAESDTDKAQFSAEAMMKISTILTGAAVAKLGVEVINNIGKVKVNKMIDGVAEMISNRPVTAKVEQMLIANTTQSATDILVIKNIKDLISSEDVLYKLKNYITNPSDQCFDSVKSIMPILKEKGYSVRVGATLCWEDIDDVLPENHFLCLITKDNRDYIIDLTGSQYDFIEQSQGGVRAALVLTKDEWVRQFKEGFNTSAFYQNRAVKYREFANTSDAEREFGSTTFRPAASYIDEQTYFVKRPAWIYKNMTQEIMNGIREVVEEYIPQRPL